MKVNISFHGVDHSESLEHFVQEKSNVLSRHLKASEHLDWVIESEGHLFSPHLSLSLNGHNEVIKSDHENAFKAVQDIADKARRILSNRHERRAKSFKSRSSNFLRFNG